MKSSTGRSSVEYHKSEVLNHLEKERRSLFAWTISSGFIAVLGVFSMIFAPSAWTTLCCVVGLVGYRECRTRATILEQAKLNAQIQFGLMSEVEKLKIHA